MEVAVDRACAGRHRRAAPVRRSQCERLVDAGRPTHDGPPASARSAPCEGPSRPTSATPRPAASSRARHRRGSERAGRARRDRGLVRWKSGKTALKRRRCGARRTGARAAPGRASCPPRPRRSRASRAASTRRARPGPARRRTRPRTGRTRIAAARALRSQRALEPGRSTGSKTRSRRIVLGRDLHLGRDAQEPRRRQQGLQGGELRVVVLAPTAARRRWRGRRPRAGTKAYWSHTRIGSRRSRRRAARASGRGRAPRRAAVGSASIPAVDRAQPAVQLRLERPPAMRELVLETAANESRSMSSSSAAPMPRARINSPSRSGTQT